MQYRQINSEEKFSDVEGLFLNNDDQLVYWPHRKRCGYIINDDTALRLSYANNFKHAGLILVVLSNLIVGMSYPMISMLITFPACSIMVIVYFLYVEPHLKFSQFKRVEKHFGPFEIVNDKFPKRIEPANINKKDVLKISFGIFDRNAF